MFRHDYPQNERLGYISATASLGRELSNDNAVRPTRYGRTQDLPRGGLQHGYIWLVGESGYPISLQEIVSWEEGKCIDKVKKFELF